MVMQSQTVFGLSQDDKQWAEHSFNLERASSLDGGSQKLVDKDQSCPSANPPGGVGMGNHNTPTCSYVHVFRVVVL